MAEWVPDVLLAEHSTWMAMGLVGTKLDLVEATDMSTAFTQREVPLEEAIEYAGEVGIDLVFETSSLTGEKVLETFAEIIYRAEEMRFSTPPDMSIDTTNNNSKSKLSLTTTESNYMDRSYQRRARLPSSECCDMGPLQPMLNNLHREGCIIS